MTLDWPASLTPQTVAWGIQKAAVQFRSPMAGSVESVDFPGHFFKISVTLPGHDLNGGGEAEAFFARLASGVDRVRVPYWRRIVPRGTLRGSPTLQTTVPRGALSLEIATSGGLQPGDCFSIGTQFFQCLSLCLPVSGVLIVPLVNRVRAQLVAGTPVVWNRPTVTCCVPSLSSTASYSPGRFAGSVIDLEEIPS